MGLTTAKLSVCPLGVLLSSLLAAATAAPVQVVVPGRGGAPSLRVSADVGSSSSFRLSVEFFDPGPRQAAHDVGALPSPSLDPARLMSNFTRLGNRSIRTAFGELTIDQVGRFTLKDAEGNDVAHATGPPTLSKEATGHEGITMPVSGSKTGPGANGRRPCLVNGGWGPPFTWDPVDKFFAFAVSPWSYDPDYIHCYPVSFDGAAPLQPPPLDSCTTITHVVPYGWTDSPTAGGGNYSKELPDSPIKVGGAAGDSTNSCCNACNARRSEGCTAWTSDNKGMCYMFSCVDQWLPPDAPSGGTHDQGGPGWLSGGLESQCAHKVPPAQSSQPTGGYIHQDGWWALGSRVDWYLAPTPNGGFDYTKALFELTGAPAVPPLYGMGFMATYWGYTSMQEVEQYMHEFRDRKLPIDSFIMDYDWFGPNSCPLQPPEGKEVAEPPALALSDGADASAAAELSNCTIHVQIDFQGFDIDDPSHPTDAASAADCCSMCWALGSACVGFTFEDGPKHCWRKWSTAGKQPANGPHTSGTCAGRHPGPPPPPPKPCASFTSQAACALIGGRCAWTANKCAKAGPPPPPPKPPPPPPPCSSFNSKTTCPVLSCDWSGSSCLVPQGKDNCGDYGYRRNFWALQSFKQPDGRTVHTKTAAEVFDHFHSPPLHMHFGGIRKPRTYSNKNLSSANGWLLPPASDVGEGPDRNYNFSVPAMREWYTSTHEHFVKDGMDFWWNDEGETAWFTYLLWNQAQKAQYTAAKPNTRSFTINRAWQPGMQRFPAVSWTGDGQSCTHQELLRGMLNGCPLTSCDLTSPDATTLVRQYQSAVFTPIMRVHMMQGTPRFPWFWPNDHDPEFQAHQDAFQMALGMRYKFLPWLYSLAHGAYRTGRPILHPASFEFPSETGTPVDTTYMVGGVLIPSDLGLAHTNIRPPPLENNSVAVLPSSVEWFRFNSTTVLHGGQTVNETLALSQMSVFIRAGALLPLHANASIQRSGDAGNDAVFDMVEDDGISLDHEEDDSGNTASATRTTTWRWADKSKALSWAVAGSFAGSQLYTSVEPVLFVGGTTGAQRAPVHHLGMSGGSVVFN